MKPYFFYIIVCLFLFSSCKKYLEVDPPANQVTTDRVFQSDDAANSTLNGIYSDMMSAGDQFCAGGTTLYAGLCADELRYYVSSPDKDQFNNNAITESVHPILESYYWNACYKFIYSANLTMEKLAVSSAVSETVQKRLTGEARFVRAFCYFYLTNLFGDVPLVVSSDYRLNESSPRTAASAVYDQMKIDLKQAASLLPAVYDGGQRVRPTKWAALALLARVSLYTGNWATADSAATLVINSGLHSLVPGLSNVFLKNSTEAIWQLLPVIGLLNTWEGFYILPQSPAAAPTYVLTSSFVNSLEPADQRAAIWYPSRVYQTQTVYYPAKYKVNTVGAPITEYYMALRLAEQYLIRAEARAELSRLPESLSDVNIIRLRAGLLSSTASTKDDLLSAIMLERRIELGAEWGNRWFDLKRTNRATAVLSPLKAGWQPTDVLWPIPTGQLRANPSLHQNPGY